MERCTYKVHVTIDDIPTVCMLLILGYGVITYRTHPYVNRDLSIYTVFTW